MIEVSIQSRGVIIGVAIDATPTDCFKDGNLDRDVRLQALEAVKDMDAETLKDAFIKGLIDAYAYPFDFTEIVG